MFLSNYLFFTSLNVTELKKISSKAVAMLTPPASIKLVHSMSFAYKSLYSRAPPTIEVSQLRKKIKMH